MKRSTILFISIFLLVVVLISQIYCLSHQYSELKDDGYIINQSGVIRGSIQRISKFVLADKECKDQIQKVDKLINNFIEESDRYKHKGYSKNFLNYVDSLRKTWKNLKTSIKNYKTIQTSANFELFWHNSEKAWAKANKMVLQAQLYSEQKMVFFRTVIAIIGLNLVFVFFIGFLINKYVRKELEFIASYDGLTNALNRTSFSTIIQKEISHSNRYETSLSLIILDIDFFKKINDTFGHQTGDKVLKELSGLIQSTVRESDYFFRIGGEEFALLLPNTSTKNAIDSARRLRKKTEENNFSQIEKLTLSLGLTEYMKEENSDSFIKRADTALYKAKENGRNRVVIV